MRKILLFKKDRATRIELTNRAEQAVEVIKEYRDYCVQNQVALDHEGIHNSLSQMYRLIGKVGNMNAKTLRANANGFHVMITNSNLDNLNKLGKAKEEVSARK